MKRAKVTPERPDWLEQLADPKEEQALAAAFDVFAEKGFDGATMSEIASKAGVSKRTLYERYTDKAHMFRALLAWGCRQNIPDDAPPKDMDGREALVLHAEALLRAMMRPESIDLVRIVASAAPRFPEIGALFDDMTRSASVKIVRSLAKRLAKDGRIEGDADDFASDFIGLLRGDLYHRALIGVAAPMAQEKIPAEAKRAVGVLLRAYRPR